MESREENAKIVFCQICQKNNWKYKCPGCGIKTCSLDCVKIHKSGIDVCDGIRQKSSFIPLATFDKLDLLNDYQFLESAVRQVDNLSRDELKKFTRKGEEAIKLPLNLTKLINANKARLCKLLILPPHFERHRLNSTRLNFNSNRITWKVEWRFPNANNKTIITHKFDEKIILKDFLEPFISASTSVADDNENNPDEFLSYKSLDFGEIQVLIKAEGIHKEPRKFYHDININKSLRWNLKNKTIIEHPIIYVVLKSHFSFYKESENYDSDPDEMNPGNESLAETVPINNPNELKNKTSTQINVKKNNFGLLSSINSSSDEEEEVNVEKDDKNSNLIVKENEINFVTKEEKEFDEKRLRNKSNQLKRKWEHSIEDYENSEYLRNYCSSSDSESIKETLPQLENQTPPSKKSIPDYKELYDHCFNYYSDQYSKNKVETSDKSLSLPDKQDNNESKDKSGSSGLLLGLVDYSDSE